MWLIITLIIVGILLLVAELVLLPGISVAGIGAFLSLAVAAVYGFSCTGFWEARSFWPRSSSWL